jgi:glycosyltransferase involved in cell wall biosynthesis
MNEPLVSILITSYNRAQYIEEAIESSLQQKYRATEIIITDNCSTDGTMKILRKYENISNVRIYQNETNLGQFQNRNKAASLAKGKYLKYVDSDDILYPFAIPIMVDAMERFSEAGFGVFTNLYQDAKPFPFMLSKEEAFRDFFERGEGLGMGPIATIFKKSAFDSVGGFTNFSVAGDMELMLQLALHFPLLKIGTCQFYWRQHADQAIKEAGVSKIYTIQNYLINKKIINHPEFPLTKKEIAALNIMNEKSITGALVKKYFIKGDWKDAKYVMTETGFSRKKLVGHLIKKLLP